MSDQQLTTQTQEAADPEFAQWSALEKEVGDAPAEAVVETKTEPAPEAIKAEDKPKDPLPYDELDKRHKNLQGALAETRGEMRQYRENSEKLANQLANMQEFLRVQQAQRQAPAQQQDDLAPLREYLGKIEQTATQAEQRAQQVEQRWTQQSEEQRLGQHVVQLERQFMAQAPDYMPALEYLAKSRMDELSVFYPDDSASAMDAAANAGFRSVAELRQAVMANEQKTLAKQAVATNQNPAELLYRIAKQRGFAAPRQAEPVKPAALESVRRGQAAAQSLSGGGATNSGSDDMSVDDLANMYLEDPDAADKMFAKMKAKGLFA